VAPKKKGKSIEGFISNAFSGARNTITGLPEGLLKVVTALGHDEAKLLGISGAEGRSQLREIGEEIGGAYKKKYGPAFHGDFSKTLGEIYKDPFGTVLDIGALASGGVAGATKAGVLAEITPDLAKITLATGGTGGEVVTRAVRGTQLAKRLKLAADKGLKKLPDDLQVLGEHSRAARLTSYRLLKKETGMKLGIGRYTVAQSKLSPTELNAAKILEEFPTPKIFKEETARLTAEATGVERRITETGKLLDLADEPKVIARLQTRIAKDTGLAEGMKLQLRMFNDPEIVSLVANPSEKILAYLPESDTLGRKAAAYLEAKKVHKGGRKGDVPALTVDNAEIRRYQPALITRGARVAPTDEAMAKLADRFGVTLEELYQAPEIKVGAIVKAADRDNFGKILSLNENGTATIRFVNRAKQIEATVDLPQELLSPVSGAERIPGSWVQSMPHELKAPEGQTIPDMIAAIKAEVQAEGRWEPIYHPQKMGVETGGVQVGTGGVSGGLTRPHQQNRGILQTLGKVAYDIDTLTPSFMRSVKWALYSDRHDELLRSSILVKDGRQILGKDGKVRKGYWIKRNKAEKIGYTERMSPEFEARLEEMFPDETIQGKVDLVSETLDDAAALATSAEGYHYWVPKHIGDKICGEYVRSSTAAKWLWEKPTTVWRHLVLNLRVGWLTNNVVGNTMMYLVRMHGPAGLKHLLDEWGQRFGTEYIKEMLAGTRMTEDDIAALFGEHGGSATMMGSQVPAYGTTKASQLGEKLSKYTIQPLRKGDIGYEKSLRGAMINDLVARSPEFKRVWEAMPIQAKKFRREGMLKALKENPEMIERVSDEVNASLGNFLQMTRFEQSVLRQASPFYAWYREIAKITLRLPLELPGRTLALEKLGEVGFAENVKKLGPDGIEQYLRALIPMSQTRAGKVLGFNTGGLNPYMTVPQTALALKALLQLQAAGTIGKIPGSPFAFKSPNENDTQQLLGMINPLIGGPGKTLTGAKGSTIMSLPEVRFLLTMLGEKSKPTATYEKTRLTELLSYLGIPVKNVDLNNARNTYRLYHDK
jgi:hypothetical protein